MLRIKTMPLTGGAIRLGRLRGNINTLGGVEREAGTQSAGLAFPSFDVKPISTGIMPQPQRKPTPIDLRLKIDLRDVRLYVDVIVDMLLQSLDGRAYSGGMAHSGMAARQLASNPEVKRVLNRLLERAGTIKSGGNRTTEEIIRMLMNEPLSQGGASGLPLKLPLSLKNIAVTREKSTNQSRLGRRERLIQEARRLVLAQLRLLGQEAEIVTKQKDGESALQMIIPRAEINLANEEAADRSCGDRHDNDTGKLRERDSNAEEKPEARKPQGTADTAQSFTAARVEYLQSYRRAHEKAPEELAEKLVDAKTLSRLSSEAAAHLSRMLEQGKLSPAKATKPGGGRANTAETVMTYAKLYSDGSKARKPGKEYNIIVKNLYYTDKMPDAEKIKLSASNISSDAGLRYAMFGRGIGGFLGSNVIMERRISADKPVFRHGSGLKEQSGAKRPAMFYAETTAAAATAAAAKIEARQSEAARQPPPANVAPDMAKLKKELASQASRELDEVIRKKLNVDKLTDKIYRNLEDRLRSERIRRGIV